VKRQNDLQWRMGTELHDLNEEQLRALLGAPSKLVRDKLSTCLTPLTRPFIEHSPFLCLATASASGACDVSPRGDPRGFVKILDDKTLFIPERPGNRLADSLRNILENPRVGLLFFLPGISDCFRVNGRARISTNAALLSMCEVEGKVPTLGLLISIKEAFLHCSKAMLRAQLWDAQAFQNRQEFPSSGEIHAALAKDGTAFDVETYDRERAARYARREGFY
jgi:uncharacterized protein